MRTNRLSLYLADSPGIVRLAPFAIFLLLTLLQGSVGEAAACWIYLAKTLAGAGMIWATLSFIPELRWSLSWQALAAGVLCFLLWIGLEGLYPPLDSLSKEPRPPWKPFDIFGGSPWAAWFFVAVRLLGSVLVVPMLEETAFRSALYRYAIRPDFLEVPLRRFDLRSFLLVSMIFAVEHNRWLPGLLCGFVFQALVLRRGHLGDAVTAHALTNLLLGLWVILYDRWEYW